MEVSLVFYLYKYAVVSVFCIWHKHFGPRFKYSTVNHCRLGTFVRVHLHERTCTHP